MLRQRGKLHQSQRFHSKVLNPAYRRGMVQRLRLAIVETFWEYTQTTKVSGIWLLRQNRTHGVSRYALSPMFRISLPRHVYPTIYAHTYLHICKKRSDNQL